MCENDVDECASEPCAHGSTCTQPAAAADVCDCVSGWAGDNCDENVDDCESIPCQQGSRCTDGFDSYACSCVSGFTGFNCGTDIDECAATPCENGGSCEDAVDSFIFRGGGTDWTGGPAMAGGEAGWLEWSEVSDKDNQLPSGFKTHLLPMQCARRLHST